MTERTHGLRAGLEYYTRTVALLEELCASQGDALAHAADLCAARIAKGGLIFLFGSGHSRMMCEEMTPRQGGFVGFYALVEQALSNHATIVGPNGLRAALHLERCTGYAEKILESFRFGPHDAFIIISTSGVRSIIIDMALGAKQRGMPVIGVVSRRHGENSTSDHPSGKKLVDIADIILDNQCPAGDCIIKLDNLDWKTGPTSTVTGGMLMNMLRVEVAERLLARGTTPTILPSHQFVGEVSAEEQLKVFYEAYRKSLVHLYM